MKISNFKINYFGSQVNEEIIFQKIKIIQREIDNFKFYLVIAGTNTSQIDGISAAGIDAESRKITALADAEFLLFGPKKDILYKLPSLPAGVTPALISNVCAKLMGINSIVIPIGINQKPYFKHLSVEEKSLRPAKSIVSGKSMPKKRVRNLYESGLSIGKSTKQPLFISESVPGGTTTAQATMEAFGLNVSDLVGSSLLNPPRQLKKEIVSNALLKANLQNNFDSIDVISAIGDPFQAFTMGLLIGARQENQTVILSGGSQMLALILLALEYINYKNKQDFVDNIFIATTDWLVRDDSLTNLLILIAERHNVNLFGFSSGLNFKSSNYQELKDYELGYVKEGVGAGGMSFLAYLKGFTYENIVSKCEFNLRIMRELNHISYFDKNK
ncbi:MAG: TIGR00303 family protein [Prochlorococcus sp. SP3034]|nr:TIGR00303 family protein [Prochlorococcus sp. SP3034]|tara:strand:- start:6440 stop:7600 length:1161 start_codon:yes stop_codon:yes gene_type:complete